MLFFVTEMTIGFIIGGVVLVTLLLVLVFYLCKHCGSDVCICTKSTQLHVRNSTLKKGCLDNDLTQVPNLTHSEQQRNAGYENHAFVASVIGTSMSNPEESEITQPFSKECLGENMEIYLQNDYSVSESPTTESLDDGRNGTPQQCDAGMSTYTGESDRKRKLNKTDGNSTVIEYHNELLQNRVNHWVDSQRTCTDLTLNVAKLEQDSRRMGSVLKENDYLKVKKSNYETDMDEGIILDQEEPVVSSTWSDQFVSKSFVKKALLGPQVLPVNNMYGINKLQDLTTEENMHSPDNDMNLLHYVSIQHLQQNSGSVKHVSHPERQESKTVYSSIDFQKSKQLQRKVVESFLKSQHAKSKNQHTLNNEYESPSSLGQTSESVSKETQLKDIKNPRSECNQSQIGSKHHPENQQSSSHNYMIKNTTLEASDDMRYQNCFQLSQSNKSQATKQTTTENNKKRKYAAPPPPVEPPPDEDDMHSSATLNLKSKPGVAPKPILKKGHV